MKTGSLEVRIQAYNCLRGDKKPSSKSAVRPLRRFLHCTTLIHHLRHATRAEGRLLMCLPRLPQSETLSMNKFDAFQQNREFSFVAVLLRLPRAIKADFDFEVLVRGSRQPQLFRN